MALIRQMVKHENECVGCPKEMGCLGRFCPNRNVPHLYCDHCKDEVDALYYWHTQEWCIDCILKDLEKVEVE